MRVFILCTGRSGSTTFIEACKHINNYSCGHETLAREFKNDRMNYPDNHIEADNRLSWFLGELDNRFGNDAFYVHLIRNREDCIESINKRWSSRTSIVRCFAEGIMQIRIERLNKSNKFRMSELYYNTINSNIKYFLKDKKYKLTIELENIDEQFKLFWKLIKAKGDLKKACNEFNIKHNPTKKYKTNYKTELKLFLLKIWRYFD